MAVRYGLDLNEVNAALHREETYASIAKALSEKTGLNVTRNVVAGIDRDMKAGKLKPFEPRPPQPERSGIEPLNYVYGIDEDNGGYPRFTGNLTIEYNRTLLISDVHLPYVDYGKLKKLPAIAEYYGIDVALIIGDWLNGDSRHHKRRTRAATLSQQAAASRDIFRYFDGTFGKYVYLGGNHDNWFAYDTNGELDFPDIARLAVPPELAGQVVVSPYDQLTLLSGGETWNLFHQDDYSKDPLAVARGMALKHQSNVVVTHMHMTAWGYDLYGRYKTVAIGGLVDPEMLEYGRLNSNRAPVSTAGIAVIVDGQETIITDFDRF